MSGRAVVVDGNHRIGLFLTKCAYHVVGAFLHFSVGALHGIQLDATAVASGIYGRYGAAAQTDAVIVSTDDNHLVAGFRGTFQTVALGAVAYASGKHNHLVVAVNFFFFFMFESKYGTANQRLSEFVSEITGSIRGLD